MKPKFRSLIAAFAPLSRSSLIVCASLCAVTSVRAIDLHKANNTDALNVATSWVENVIPGTTDNLIWDSTRTAAGLYSFGNAQFTGGVTIQNPGGLVQLRVASSGTTTWANNALIDMSAATVDAEWTGGTLRIATANSSPTVTVPLGRTLTLGGNGINNQGNTKTLTMAGAGNIIINPNMGGGGAMNFNINGPTVTMNNAASSWTFGTVTSGKLVLGTGTVLDGKSLYLNVANGLEFTSGVTTASLGGLGGNGDIVLADLGSTALGLTIGSNNVNQTYTGLLSGAGSLTKVGTGTQQMGSAGHSYVGMTTVSGGSLQFNNSGGSRNNLLGDGALNLAGGGRVRFNSTNSVTFGNDLDVGTGGGEISSRGSTFFQPPTITGSGVLTLAMDSGATVTPSTLDWNGTINVTSGGGSNFRLAASGTTFTNASINLGAGVSMGRNAGTNGTFTTHIGTLSGLAGSFVGGSAAGNGVYTFSVGARNEPADYAGIIVDGGTKTAFAKVGTATQILSGINTYTGDTTVSAGTLSITNAYLANTSTVHIAAGGAKMKLDFAGNDLIAGLELVGLGLMGPGTYNATSHPAYFDAAGTGSLVIPAAGAGYSSWASLNGASPTNADEDHDFDGVSNGVEFFIGGPNGNTTGFTALPGVTTVGATRSVTWTHAADYAGTYGTGFVVQTSTTLAAGSWTNEASPGTVAISGNNVTYTFTAGPVKNFVRLVVTP